jgi:hypothetical protein
MPAQVRRSLAWVLLTLPTLASPAPAATPGAGHAGRSGEPDSAPALVCLHDGIEPSGTERLIEEALAVLKQSGHRPAAYRLDLRMEDARSPDAPAHRSTRVPSVVFLPLLPGEFYPLRVHPVSPCVASWVWQPERFTPWQREVLARAREQIDMLGPAARTLGDLQVQETLELIRIEFLQGSRRLYVTLNKRGLEVVDVVRRDETAGE